MRTIAAIFFLLAFSPIGIGEEISDKALAIEYLQVSRMEPGINAMIDTYSLQLYGNMPEADRTQLKKFMEDVMGWDAIKDQLAELVVKLYTREELNAAIAFEKSRLGASISAKNEQFSKQFIELLSQNMQRFARSNSISPAPAAKRDR
jgi:hypothetical protein